jgi:hypothetical protein
LGLRRAEEDCEEKRTERTQYTERVVDLPGMRMSRLEKE